MLSFLIVCTIYFTFHTLVGMYGVCHEDASLGVPYMLFNFAMAVISGYFVVRI